LLSAGAGGSQAEGIGKWIGTLLSVATDAGLLLLLLLLLLLNSRGALVKTGSGTVSDIPRAEG